MEGRSDLQIKLKNNDRYLEPSIYLTEDEKKNYIPPEVGKWYPVTDVHQAWRKYRREGIDTNTYFINVNGIRMGIHGIHCQTNGYDYPTNTKEFFEKFREKQKEKEGKAKSDED